MIDHLAGQLVLRARAINAVAATTGATSLSATATGYARTVGSFLTDGFRVGMEIVPSGFAANPVDTITGVTDLALTTTAARDPESASGGRSLVVGLPVFRAWENVEFPPVIGRPYIEESFVPATSRGLSFPAASGTTEETGLYVLKLYCPDNTGAGALRKLADAVLVQFAPATTFDPTGDGSTSLRVRSDVGPFAGQLLPLDGGWACITVTVPWRAFSLNVVAA